MPAMSIKIEYAAFPIELNHFAWIQTAYKRTYNTAAIYSDPDALTVYGLTEDGSIVTIKERGNK